MKFFISIILYLNIALLSINAQTDSIGEIDRLINYQSQKFKYILETAYANHLDSLAIENVSEAAFKAMLKAMDEHSNYFSAKQLKEVQERNAGKSEGIGVRTVVFNDSALVASVIDGSPADSAGIRRGFKLLFVDDIAISGKSTDEINELINGEPGSTVSTIFQDYADNSLKQYVLTRTEVPISSINTMFMLPNRDIGFIASTNFNAIIDEEISTAIDDLIQKGMKSLIIDLRGNPGGYLEQVAKLLAKFLPKGKTITYTNSRNPDYTLNYETNEDGKYKNIPLVVIINENSASASEIFAGAIQDLDRGIVVGNTSFGKGTVQRMWTVNDGSGFRITVAEYHTSLGRPIDKTRALLGGSKAELDESLRLSLGDESFEHLKESFEKVGGRTTIPVFKTEKGRTLFATGGIFPDRRVEADTLTLLSRVLRSRGILLEFSFDYFKNNEKNLRTNYPSIEIFLEKFNISETLYNDFVEFSFSKNIWNDNMAKTDKNIIKNLLKASIAHFLWDNMGYQAVVIHSDKYMNSAIEEIENAMLLLTK